MYWPPHKLKADQKASDILSTEDIDGTDERNVRVWANEHGAALRLNVIQAVNASGRELHIGSVGHHGVVDVHAEADVR